jgi:transcriptional regulator GlxA family with amidase domain
MLNRVTVRERSREQCVTTTQPASRIPLRVVSAGDALGSAGAIPATLSHPIHLADVVVRLLDRAAEAVDNDSAAAKHWIARASSLLQDRACRGTTTHERGGLAPWQVRLVAKHIDSVLASAIKTHDCARIARLSTSHFRRAFKVSFGVSLHRYISQRRVERAQEMMVLTDQPVCQIARSCGFADPAHFTRVFRRLVGVGPANWRRL